MPSTYQTIVIRCWQESGKKTKTPVWRFALENPATQERQGFTQIEKVTQALQDHLNDLTGVTAIQTNQAGNHVPDNIDDSLNL